MSVIAHIPAPLRKAAAKLLPATWAEWIRRAIMRPYHLPYVVVRESAARRFFNRHILRLYYPPSMITRQSAFARWISADVLRKKPRLHHFDIHVTDHCNLNCKGCLHFCNLADPMCIDAEVFERDLADMAGLFDVDQIYILGGEALLHPDISDLLPIARKHFPDTRICLMTNGILVTRMDESFWKALAETGIVLVCTVYPIRLPREQIETLAKQHGVALEWTEARSEFYRIPIDLAGSQDEQDSFRRCSGIGNCATVRDGRLYPCAYAAYADIFASKFELTGLEATEDDSLDIHNPPSSREAMRFMRRPVPWCRHCDFDKFSMYEWGRTERKLDEWVC